MPPSCCHIYQVPDGAITPQMEAAALKTSMKLSGALAVEGPLLPELEGAEKSLRIVITSFKGWDSIA